MYVLNRMNAYRSDTTASTTIHRLKLNTGETNYYIANIDRFGKDPYVVEYEQTIMDGYILMTHLLLNSEKKQYNCMNVIPT